MYKRLKKYTLQVGRCIQVVKLLSLCENCVFLLLDQVLGMMMVGCFLVCGGLGWGGWTNNACLASALPGVQHTSPHHMAQSLVLPVGYVL